MEHHIIKQCIILAGCAQIALATGSTIIPKLLNWKQELAKTPPLIRQIFCVYAAYILVINLCFGLVSAFAADELTNRSALATMLCGFIAVYWISRLSIQFLHFERSTFPKGKIYSIGEAALVTVFVTLSVIYSLAFYFNL